MKGKIWYLVGFLILSVSVMEISCWLYPTRKTHAPTPDPRRTYMTEYDCQISSNILSPAGRKERLQLAFDQANTDLEIVYSEEYIPDTVVSWELKGMYMSWHWHTTGGPDPRFVFKSYTISVCSLSNVPPDEGVVLGWSSGRGMEGLAMGMILTGTIRFVYMPSDSMEIKVLLHEWGHMRDNLPHLCLSAGGGMDFDNHNQQDCLMAQTEIAECTGQWVDRNMHFCGICLDKLKKVTW